MLIFITVYHDLKNLFPCSHKFSLNLLHTNRHTDCVGPMWVLSNSSSACNFQRRRIYSPKMVQLCSSYRIYYASSIWRYTYCIWPCIQLRLDASIESEGDTIMIEQSNKVWMLRILECKLTFSGFMVSVRDIFWLYCKLLLHFFGAI